MEYNPGDPTDEEAIEDIDIRYDPNIVFLANTDINGRSQIDVIVADCSDDSATSDNIGYYQDEKFDSSKTTIPIGKDTRDIFCCDVNDDGYNELVTADYWIEKM